MKKIFISIFLALLIFPVISAININVEKQSSDEVLISGLNRPAIFDLRITNFGSGDSFEFYNLLGFRMFPLGTVNFGQGETKNVELKISPIGEFTYRGIYSLEYFIRAQDSSEIKQKLTFRVIDLKDAFEIGSQDFDPEINSVEIFIQNRVNFDFGQINAKLSSSFFSLKEDFELGSYERKTFSVQLNKEEFKELVAGFYTLSAEITVEDEKANVEGIIKFVEKDILTTTTEDFGFFVNTKIIRKTNEGNLVTPTETIVRKNIISRLFTSFNPEPDSVERQGFKVYYTWAKKINPGEVLEISVKTNWLFPLVIIFFVIAIVLLAKQYSSTHLTLRKKVTFVKAKGGRICIKGFNFCKCKEIC